MADVYGFNEAKSKIAVVDKATQDAKDASQDTSITGLDERITAVEETIGNMDRTIPVEYYGEVVENANDVGTITLPKAFTRSGSSASTTWYIQKTSTGVNADGLYYDGDNGILKRCVTQGVSYGYSGSLRTTYNAVAYASSYQWLMDILMEFMNSEELYTCNKTPSLKVGNIIISCPWYEGGNPITSMGDYLSVYGTSSSISLAAGTHEVRFAWNDTDYGWHRYATSTPMDASPPSTYKQVADLLA